MNSKFYGITTCTLPPSSQSHHVPCLFPLLYVSSAPLSPPASPPVSGGTHVSSISFGPSRQPLLLPSSFFYSHPHLQDDPASSSESDDEPLNGGFLMKISKGGTGSSGDGQVVAAAIHKEATEVLGLPDVRDGLKPVDRMILCAMHQLGVSSKKPFKTCGAVLGEVLVNFRHYDSVEAVYDALVGMAQHLSLRYPLIQGRGNFGSIRAYPPAAMHRTECRLQALTEAVFLADLEQDTVDFVPNFDNSEKEPSLLPARLPTLLLNVKCSLPSQPPLDRGSLPSQPSL